MPFFAIPKISAMITSLSRLLDEFSIISKVISISLLDYCSIRELGDLQYKSCFTRLNISNSVISTQQIKNNFTNLDLTNKLHMRTMLVNLKYYFLSI